MNEQENLDPNSNEEKLEIDMGTEENFFVAENGNYFGIAFDKFFDMPEFSVYNTFEMSSKRNFKNLTPIILNTYQDLFLNEQEELKPDVELIFFHILKTKSDIMCEKLTYNDFISRLDNIIEGGDHLLRNLIDQFVEENYSLNLDKITQDTKDKKRKVNVELQLTDSLCKELLKISYLYRVMIPIVSIYFYYNKGTFQINREISESERILMDEYELEEIEFDEVNQSTFAYLFNKFATNPEALKNKLYRLAFSGVSKTSYSDKRFWAASKNLGITEKTEALEIYKKIIINAIPKLSIDGDKNPVSFLQSVINNQVDFLFQNKFKYRFIPLDGSDQSNCSTDDNDDNMTEFERIEIQQSRKDEGSYLIRKLNIKDVVEKIPEKFNVGISDAEVKEVMQTIERNAIQERIIAFLTFKYFNDKDALKFVSFYQYCFLLIACKKYLLQQKYIYLPLILTAKCEKHRERVNIAGKKVKPEILRSKKYTDLVNEKYQNFHEEIEGPFMALIGTIYSSVFKDANGNEIFDSSVKVGKIAEEILNLAALI